MTHTEKKKKNSSLGDGNNIFWLDLYISSDNKRWLTTATALITWAWIMGMEMFGQICREKNVSKTQQFRLQQPALCIDVL